MKQVPGSNLVSIGIDLSDFYLSVEWDLLEVPASRNEEYYPCCPEPYSGTRKSRISKERPEDVSWKFVCYLRYYFFNLYLDIFLLDIEIFFKHV